MGKVACLIHRPNLPLISEAKERLILLGKELSDDAIEEEIHILHLEKKAAELKTSLRNSHLFQPVCQFMQENKEWSGTTKQFKDAITTRFPETFEKWYKAIHKYVDELARIIPELQEEGIAIEISTDKKSISLSKS